MSLILTAVLVAKLPLVVRMYDSAGVAARVLEHARQSARTTLAAAGLDPIWRPCHASGCVGRPKAHEVVLRLVKATASSERGSLGFAAVDVVERTGTLATVYVDRVDALAAQAEVDPGELLGRAIAHEIGHLLLGTAGHARSGLMRATWKTVELQRDLPLDWIFSEGQGAEMRGRLTARASGQPVVESVVALAHLSAEVDDPEGDEWMAATSKTIYKDNNLRVGPGGVFVKNQKLADLEQVVECIPRDKVVSLTRK